MVPDVGLAAVSVDVDKTLSFLDEHIRTSCILF